MLENLKTTIKTGKAFHEGNKHNLHSVGYQDSSVIVGDENIFVGIICDGCSTTPWGTFSQNQFGSILGSEIIAHTLYKKITQQIFYENEFYNILKKTIVECANVYKKIIRSLRKVSYNFNLEKFVLEKMAFTFIGIVVWNNYYWIFGIGNGCFGVNEIYKILPDRKLYFSNYLLKNPHELQPELYINGRIDLIRNIWIASDGCDNFFNQNKYSPDFENFLSDPRTCNIDDIGFDNTIRSFRTEILNKNKIFFPDDVTILVFKINRI